MSKDKEVAKYQCRQQEPPLPSPQAHSAQVVPVCLHVSSTKVPSVILFRCLLLLLLGPRGCSSHFSGSLQTVYVMNCGEPCPLFAQASQHQAEKPLARIMQYETTPSANKDSIATTTYPCHRRSALGREGVLKTLASYLMWAWPSRSAPPGGGWHK